MPDPSVSPADAIRRALEALHCHCGECAECETYDAAIAALDEFLAVGERDRRQIAQLTEALDAAPSVGDIHWLAAVLDVMDARQLWPTSIPWDFHDERGTIELELDGSDDTVQRDLRAFADKLASARAVLADEEDAANG